MLRIQLGGLPLKTYRRLRPNLDRWAADRQSELQLRVSPSNDEYQPRLQLADIEKNIEDGFIHIVVVPTRETRDLVRQQRYRCRTTLLEPEDRALDVGWNEFQSLLTAAFRFERRWCKAVGPSDLAHPLLLPNSSFEPVADLSGFWTYCDCYGTTTLLTNAHNLVGRFSAIHRQHSNTGSYWLDRAGRSFRVDRSFHGRSERERRGRKPYRFCFEVPPGFHYDVVNDQGATFSINGSATADGNVVRHSNVVRANVTSFGHLTSIHR
jgi:hypothetical protein